MTKDQFEGCIIGGAIGDAWGSSFENEIQRDNSKTAFIGKGRSKPARKWEITDDTQLTLATCEVLAEKNFSIEKLANKFVSEYRNRKIKGLGASTLKAILDLEAGINWRQAGRTGEYAAGNGAAMRIAPFAFYPSFSRDIIFDACRITHNNSEAYAGALAVLIAVKSGLNNEWKSTNDLLKIVIRELPDTRLKDRLIEINKYSTSNSIAEIAKLGNNGYVVNSIPFAIFCSSKVLDVGFSTMIQQIVESGGDTDTNASIAGQIAGAQIGISQIPTILVEKLHDLKEYIWINEIIERTNPTKI